MMIKNRIAMLRRMQGLNQKELGQEIGVGQTTVSAWETGKNEPDSESMYKMAQLFHVSIGYLAGYEGDSFIRGFSQKEYDAILEQERGQSFQRKIECERQEIERIEEQGGFTDEEFEKILREHNMHDWENSEKADTYEGYIASRIIDQASKEERIWLLESLKCIANYPLKKNR